MISRGKASNMTSQIRGSIRVPKANVVTSASFAPMTHKTATITISHEYTNYSDTPFYIKTQSNIPLSISPNHNSASCDEQRPHLEVRQIITIHSGSDIYDTYELLGAIKANTGALSDCAEEIRSKLSELYAVDAGRRNKVNFPFSVKYSALEEDVMRGGRLHLREVDVIVTKVKEDLILPHPNSSEGLQQFSITSNKAFESHAGILVRVVDNESIAKARFYHAAKQLISVPSSDDETIKSGVYSTVATMAADGFIDRETVYYTFEEAEEKLGMYRTREEALSHGNPEFALRAEEAKNRAEEARLTAETRKLSNDLELLRKERELEILDSERELRALTHSLEITKAENAQIKESMSIREAFRADTFSEKDVARKNQEREDQRLFTKEDLDRKLREQEMKNYYAFEAEHRKDYYDRRSSERKDTSEMIKYIPAILIGALGAYALVQTKTK